MTTHKEALKLALEALENSYSLRDDVIAAKAAIKEALAQPEQEPVAWMNPYGGVLLRLFTGLEKNSYTIPLYTAPPQRTWVGLTDEERDNFWKADQMTSKEWAELFDAIEAKLKEKNT